LSENGVTVGRQDRCEPLLGPGELLEDMCPGLFVQGSVRLGDQPFEHRNERRVLAGELVQIGPGGVDQADAVVGEVRGLDHPRPRVRCEAGRNVAIARGGRWFGFGVGDGLDQFRHAAAELAGDYR
jgi:hypothetical protein